MVAIHVDKGLPGKVLVDALARAAAEIDLEATVKISEETIDGKLHDYANIRIFEYYCCKCRTREIGSTKIPLDENKKRWKILYAITENLDDDRREAFSDNIYAELSKNGDHKVANGNGQSQ